MYGRALIPIIKDENIIGVTGRSIYGWIPKYKNNEGFPSCNYLFNYENAKDKIKESKEVYIVESPMNCIRLEEGGIKNSVALFGVSFSMEKQLLLDQLGTMNINLILDNDEAGQEAAQKIIKNCSLYYNMKNIQIKDYKDIGEIPKEKIKEIINE